MRTLLLYLCVCLSLFSCKKEDATAGSGSGAIFIRVRNASQYQFDNIVVTSPGGQNTYGTVAIGQSSDYKAFSQAYRYAQLNLAIQGQALQLLPTDYVGETPLQPGRYTYAVDVTNGNPRRLTISLEKP
jgi:hypothetical protein